MCYRAPLRKASSALPTNRILLPLQALTCIPGKGYRLLRVGEESLRECATCWSLLSSKGGLGPYPLNLPQLQR